MFSNIALGVYYPGNSLLHRLQARTKLLIIIWLAVFVAVADRFEWHFVPYIAVGVLLFLGILLSGIAPRVLWQRLWLLLLLSAIGIIPAVFFSNVGTTVLTTFGPWPVAYGTLRWIIFGYGIVFASFLLVQWLPNAALRVIRQRLWFHGLRVLLIILTIIALLFLWITHSAAPEALLPIGPIVLTYDGVWYTMAFFVAFLSLYTFSILLTMTTPPIALIEGLTLLMTPLRWLKLPVDDFALMTLIALRFVPTLIEEAEQLIKAQISRGSDLSQGSIRERMQSLAMLFVPFIQATLRRAEDLSIALDARGYQSEKRQTLLHEKAIQRLDIVVVLIVVFITIGSFIL